MEQHFVRFVVGAKCAEKSARTAVHARIWPRIEAEECTIDERHRRRSRGRRRGGGKTKIFRRIKEKIESEGGCQAEGEKRARVKSEATEF